MDVVDATVRDRFPHFPLCVVFLAFLQYLLTCVAARQV